MPKMKTTGPKKKISILEFKAWLDGVEELQPAGWSPTPDQWKLIRNKIKLLDVKSDAVTEAAVTRPVGRPHIPGGPRRMPPNPNGLPFPPPPVVGGIPDGEIVGGVPPIPNTNRGIPGPGAAGRVGGLPVTAPTSGPKTSDFA